MVKRHRRRTLDRSQSAKYHRVGRGLYRSACDLSELASEDEGYGNAIGILVVHAAIAYGDALCIAFGGFKSTAADHLLAVKALKDALGSRARSDRLKDLTRIIGEKDAIAYQGSYYATEDAQVLLERLKVFRTWAENLYRERPA